MTRNGQFPAKIAVQAARKGIGQIQKCIESSAPHYNCVILPSSVCDHSIVAFDRFVPFFRATLCG